MTTTKKAFASALALALCINVPGSTWAGGNILTNGDFSQNGGSGQLTVNTSLTGWTGGGVEGNNGNATPPVFVFTQGTTTATGDSFMGNISFYGDPTTATGAPSGTTIAADGDGASNFEGSISQTVSGLKVGDTYSLDFNWAGAQQTGYTGATTEHWLVSFGSQMLETSTVDTPSHGFVGWQKADLTFTATSTSQVLEFLAVGTPQSLPPWLLLNGVSMTDTTNSGGGGGGNPGGGGAVPEPGALSLLAFGLIGASAVGVRYRRRARA